MERVEKTGRKTERLRPRYRPIDQKGSPSLRRGDTDLYGYCLNDPVNWVDPWGLLVAYIGPGASAGAGIGTEGDSVNYMSLSGYKYRGTRRDGGIEEGFAGSAGGGRMFGGTLGIGLEGGILFGDVEDLCGKGTAVGVTFLIFNFEATFNDIGNSWTGFNFGLLKSVGLGVYSKETITGRIPTARY